MPAYIVILGVIVFGALLFYGPLTRSRRMLDQWAANNGYRITSAEYRWLRRGPFFWTSNSQTVYRLTIIDGQGNSRRGWARCGSYFLGLMQNRVEIRWDAESSYGVS